MPALPPKGPKSQRKPDGITTNTATINSRSDRGGIRKQRGPVRADKDGDLSMTDVAGAGSRARGGRGRGSGVTRHGPAGRGDPGAALQKAISRGISTGDANVRGPSRLSEIRIKGLKESKAASNPDGGLKDLVGFLERKATERDTPSSIAAGGVRIRKVCLTI